jgi:hypothetical protein
MKHAQRRNAARHRTADAFKNGDDRVALEIRIVDDGGVRLINFPVDAKTTGGSCTTE